MFSTHYHLPWTQQQHVILLIPALWVSLVGPLGGRNVMVVFMLHSTRLHDFGKHTESNLASILSLHNIGRRRRHRDPQTPLIADMRAGQVVSSEDFKKSACCQSIMSGH